MLYLLDANVLIQAHEEYYPLDRIPQFWVWLVEEAVAGHAKMPFEIHNEIADAEGSLKDWITTPKVKNMLILPEEVDQGLFNQVLDYAYAPDLKDDELEEAGQDPFLIAYGLMGPERVIVTKEISKPTKKRGRRKVPDACNIMGIPCVTDFEFYKKRNFHIP